MLKVEICITQPNGVGGTHETIIDTVEGLKSTMSKHDLATLLLSLEQAMNQSLRVRVHVSLREMPLALTWEEECTLLAEYQFPCYNWRHVYGEGCVPGEEHDAAATRIVIPDYSNDTILRAMALALPVPMKIVYGNVLFKLVHGHDPKEEDDGMPIEGATVDQRVDALLYAIMEAK